VAARERAILESSAGSPRPKIRTDCANNASPIISLVFSESRDWHNHDRSAAKPFFMDCNVGGRLDLGMAPTGSIRRSSPSNFQRRSFRLGSRRDSARDQPVAPLSRGSHVVLSTLDPALGVDLIRLVESQGL